ncbi:MAG: hypothetical protein V1715_00085 [bacterium]
MDSKKSAKGQIYSAGMTDFPAGAQKLVTKFDILSTGFDILSMGIDIFSTGFDIICMEI